MQSNHNRGVSKEVIEENKDDIYTNAKANAELRANYILAQIAEKEGIKVTEQNSAAKSLLRLCSKNQAAKNGRSTQGKRRHHEVEEILNAKVIDLLEEKATSPRSIPNRILINSPPKK